MAPRSACGEAMLLGSEAARERWSCFVFFFLGGGMVVFGCFLVLLLSFCVVGSCWFVLCCLTCVKLYVFILSTSLSDCYSSFHKTRPILLGDVSSAMEVERVF